MEKYWVLVNDVIKRADVLLLVLDARMIRETRNYEVEQRVRYYNKPLVYVLNKCDLVEGQVDTRGLSPFVILSSTQHMGTLRLRQRIVIEAKRAGVNRRPILVGVLGYPNVGKSSLANALKGKKSAGTSISSGYTKGLQNIRAGSIALIDTPGVIPHGEKLKSKHVIMGSIDFAKVKDPDVAVMALMRKYPGLIESEFGVAVNYDYEQTLEEIALKKRIIKKGGKPDVERMSRAILQSWQRGELTAN